MLIFSLLCSFMLFYGCNDDEKNPHISFLGYSGHLVPKTEKSDALPVTETKRTFRNENIGQHSLTKR